MTPIYRVEALTSAHDRKTFRSGDSALDQYLVRFARQDMRKSVTVAYVLVVSENPTKILGFYTLSARHLTLQDIPQPWQNRLPKYPEIPVALLGRLAVAESSHNQKLGTLLVSNALTRAAQLHQHLGLAGVLVEAKQDAVCTFYESLGFARLSPESLRLFLPMTLILKIIDTERSGHTPPRLKLSASTAPEMRERSSIEGLDNDVYSP